jgi:sugar lactone lactonase YvrE
VDPLRSAAGTFQGPWGNSGNGSGEFISPEGVAVTPDGATVYVVDTVNERIQAFCVPPL